MIKKIGLSFISLLITANINAAEASQGTILLEQQLKQGINIEQAVTQAILAQPVLTEDIVEAAIKIVGKHSSRAQGVINAAIKAQQTSLNQQVARAITKKPTNAANIVTAAIEAVCKKSEPEQSKKPIKKSLIQKKCLDITAAQSILVSAITTTGPESPLIRKILNAAKQSGLNSDSVTALAIASGVDASLASEATAAGPDNSPAKSHEIKSNNNTAGRGTGNGGGGGGISENL